MKVLVIEDDEIQRRVAQLYLQKNGHEVNGTHKGKEGVELAMTWKPDVIILDLGLVGISGLDTLRILKSNPAAKHIPVIIVTADAAQIYKEEVNLAGGHVYLEKPLTEKILLYWMEKIAEIILIPIN